MCTHYFSDDIGLLWWYFKQEWKNNWDHSHFNQFQITASTVLIQQVPFSRLYFDEQVPSLQILITVLFSADLQTPRTALSGFPTTLPVFQNVSTHFMYPCAHSVDASFTHAPWIDENCSFSARRRLAAQKRHLAGETAKIEHLPRDASAILRERYLAGTFSVVTQWTVGRLSARVPSKSWESLKIFSISV